ncbi:MAG: type II CRISPR RNA-guided endonuclease Cas9, partial [Rhodocyclaceae bacterium]
MGDKTPQNLTFGFDIGIASVGWCVLGENRIVDLGVRCFDKAETADKGESLNLARRTARLMRRRLRRRAWRLVKLARLLKREGLIASIEAVRSPSPVSPWRLRVEGLDRCLTSEEWARVIYHLCKHRGFHWASRAEEKKAESDEKEVGKVKQGLADTQRRMREKGYRSAAEMVLVEFPHAQRNKAGRYDKALSRDLLAGELMLLFKRQRELGNPQASAELETKILGNGDRKSGLFWQQKPPLSGKALIEMLGRCTFERSGGSDGKGEYRAPKASFTAERHVWLTRLNNLRIVVDGVTRPLNEDERKIVLP